MLLALGVLMTPVSNFLLWLQPFMKKGSVSEWFMMMFYLVFAAALLAIFWKGQMLRRLSFEKDMPVFIVFIISHVSNIIFALIGGFYRILWLQFLAASVQIALILFIYYRSKSLPQREAEQK